MPFITFDVGYRRAVEAALADWAQTLPRSLGQIGGPVISTVEAPQTGTTIRLLVEPDFVDFLRIGGSVPFQKQ